MSKTREFDRFLLGQRFRESTAMVRDDRNPFENDFTRVIFSSAFRRLQDKTQVFQLDKGDFVRTRLTHSMEVSSLGRSIGLSLENRLIDMGKLSAENRGSIPSILATAGLVHDLGNPPFGHFGESVIREFFRDYFVAHPEIVADLTEQQRDDLLYFDGNVQTFRVLRKLHYLKDRDGMNLTFPVLATIVKYPFNSLDGNQKNAGLSRKKFGFFQSEEQDFIDLKRHVGFSGRFPLTPLLEAADDIAYSVADIEDACKKGILGRDDILQFLRDILIPMALSPEEQEMDFVQCFEQLYCDVERGYKNRLELAVQRFRIIVQGFMINAAIDSYCAHFDEICEGTYDRELLVDSYASNISNVFKRIGREKIYVHKSILESEIVGYNVIRYLFDELVPAVLLEGKANTQAKQSRYYNMLSSNYRFIYENFTGKTTYNRLQLVTDYVSGMTDNYVVKQYQKWLGLSRS